MLVPKLQTISIYGRRKNFNLKRKIRYPGSRNISVCILIIFYKLTFVSSISDRLLKSHLPLHILALLLISFSAWGARGSAVPSRVWGCSCCAGFCFDLNALQCHGGEAHLPPSPGQCPLVCRQTLWAGSIFHCWPGAHWDWHWAALLQCQQDGDCHSQGAGGVWRELVTLLGGFSGLVLLW